MMKYLFLDYFFVIFHMLLITFNLSGWIFKRTRSFHLITISLTVLSWYGLGIFYGWGYCPLTEWHWKVKINLGETNLPGSYVKYYVDKVTGLSWDPTLIDFVVVFLGIFAFILSCYYNYKDYSKIRDNKITESEI